MKYLQSTAERTNDIVNGGSIAFIANNIIIMVLVRVPDLPLVITMSLLT